MVTSGSPEKEDRPTVQPALHDECRLAQLLTHPA